MNIYLYLIGTIKKHLKMKTLKYIFLVLLILVVLGAVYLATLEGDYDVKRSRIIHANPEVVFNDLNDYKNWKTKSVSNDHNDQYDIHIPHNRLTK